MDLVDLIAEKRRLEKEIRERRAKIREVEKHYKEIILDVNAYTNRVQRTEIS